MPIFAKKVSNMTEFNEFMENFGEISRAIYFSNSEEPPKYFKGLTSHFKDKLEFAFVTPDAADVYKYMNQTTSPRWIVLKRMGKVNFQRRNYLGKRTFEDLKAYLAVFAHKTGLDRRGTDYKKKMRDRGSHTGEALNAQDFDFTNFDRNINFEDEIVIVHVTDALSMDFPNLKIFQKNFG